jgi:hypothetical protein
MELLVTTDCRSTLLMEDPGGTSSKCLYVSYGNGRTWRY